jgi:threonine dehydrogenase-like Zn-dependent dehydrogenase
MRAVALDFRDRTLRERDVAEPFLESDDEVLLRIRETGICGTDRELARFEFGRPPDGSSFLIIGHEAVGEVIRTGSGVRDLQSGDIVVPTVRRSCHPPCRQCARGRRDLCLTGGYAERGIVGLHGYFAEFAVDHATDLVRVPRELASVAVLAEPLSVVEKAVETALRLHMEEPRTALVVGAGSIGLLAVLVLRLRGLDVDVCSVEPESSRRARLVEQHGGRYLRTPDRTADLVLEASGDAEGLRTGYTALAPLGVLMVLGAPQTPPDMLLWPLILGNQLIAGTVNASPDAFLAAVHDLGRIPRHLLDGLTERLPFDDYERSIYGSAPHVPKMIHVIP